MKYRGLRWNVSQQAHEWVYGLPSYGFNTEEIAEMGTPNGDFCDIDPATIGKQTEYRDRHGTPIYTGDITTLLVDGEVREFEVIETTMDREYKTLPGFVGGTVKVRLSGVVAFRWTAPDGKVFDLLPCVDDKGISDTERMEIVDTAAERTVRGAGEGEKQQHTLPDMGIR